MSHGLNGLGNNFFAIFSQTFSKRMSNTSQATDC